VLEIVPIMEFVGMGGREIERGDQETPAHGMLLLHDPEVGTGPSERIMHQNQLARAGDPASIRGNGYATARWRCAASTGSTCYRPAAAWVRGSRDPVRDELMATLRSHLRRYAAEA
jgi:hypothetical protein